MPPTASLSKQIATWRERGIRGSGALPAPLGDDQGSGPHWAWGVQQGSPRALRSTWGEKEFEGLPREGRGQGTGAPQPSPLHLPGAGGKGWRTGRVQALDTKSPVSQMRRSLCPGKVTLAHLVDILPHAQHYGGETFWGLNGFAGQWSKCLCFCQFPSPCRSEASSRVTWRMGALLGSEGRGTCDL